MNDFKVFNLAQRFSGPFFEDMIIGPVSFYEVRSEVFGLHLYLFGDHHDKSSKIEENLTSTLQKLFEAFPKKLFDFFFEFPYIINLTNPEQKDQIEKAPKECYLCDVRKSFSDCFQKDKSKCRFKNVRFHYCDIRRDSYIRKLDQISSDLNHFGKFEDFKIYFDSNEKVKKDEIIVQLKIERQLNNIEGFGVKSLILTEIDQTLEILNQVYQEEKKNEYLSLDSRKKIKSVFNKLIEWYTLGRLFRTYKIKRNDYPSSKAQNVIMYFGQFHIRNFIKFFKKLDFKIIIYQQIPNLTNLKLNDRIKVLFDNLTDPKVKKEIKKQFSKIEPMMVFRHLVWVYQKINLDKVPQPFFNV